MDLYRGGKKLRWAKIGSQIFRDIFYAWIPAITEEPNLCRIQYSLDLQLILPLDLLHYFLLFSSPSTCRFPFTPSIFGNYRSLPVLNLMHCDIHDQISWPIPLDMYEWATTTVRFPRALFLVCSSRSSLLPTWAWYNIYRCFYRTCVRLGTYNQVSYSFVYVDCWLPVRDKQYIL